ncbi:P-loop containing nucleoside triphosphate hydrolase protein [Butyriboletus roseoflavus]|nr:P-loop containing nucleoside triphosphate hydrolase protein [Butyriboletus roseoflavus]
MSSLGAPISSLKNAKGSGVRAIVLAPTRELAHQIHNECLKLAVGRKWRVVLFSKATASTLRDKNVRDKVDIIIGTPLRLIASIQEGNVDLNKKQVFSATLAAGVEQLAMGILRNPIRIIVGLKDTPLPLISQSLTYVADDASKLPSLLTYFAQPYKPPLLIFTSTQSRATSLAEELTLHGIANVDCLHAGMTKKERDDAISRMRRGESWVMVSTEVMARGMDFKGVREVINYDFPTSVQSYIHRIGRTGRAGRDGKAVTYFTDDDAPYLKSIANVLLQSGSTVPDWIVKLPKPSKLKKRQMGKMKRADSVNAARQIGRRECDEETIRRSLRLSHRPPVQVADYDWQGPEVITHLSPPSPSVCTTPSSVSPPSLITHLPFAPGSSHTRNRKEGHIPRPPNAFMVFRSWLWNKDNLKSIEKDNRNVSRIAGRYWNELSEAERAPFRSMAEQAKARHAQLYPQYRYSPTSQKKPKASQRRAQRSTDAENEKCKKVADMLLGGIMSRDWAKDLAEQHNNVIPDGVAAGEMSLYPNVLERLVPPREQSPPPQQKSKKQKTLLPLPLVSNPPSQYPASLPILLTTEERFETAPVPEPLTRTPELMYPLNDVQGFVDTDDIPHLSLDCCNNLGE